MTAIHFAQSRLQQVTKADNWEAIKEVYHEAYQLDGCVGVHDAIDQDRHTLSEAWLEAVAKLPEQLPGMELDSAVTVAAAFGYRIRATSIDGNGTIGTCDLRNDRINVSVVNGKVEHVKGIG